MAGRDLFQKIKPVLTGISAVFSVMPRILFELTWPLLELMPWRLGILLRYLWAKRLAKACGDNVLFETGVRVTHWDKIEFGNNVAIFETCYLDGQGGIKIGNDVSIAHQCSLVSFYFDLKACDGPLKYAEHIYDPIELGSDILVFSGTRILAGTKLCDHSVVAANSVLAKGHYQSGLYAGSPAQFKRAVNGDSL